MAADDCRVSPDGSSAPNDRACVLVSAHDLGARICNIRKDAGRAAEDIVLQLHSGIDRYVVLDLDVVADYHARSDEYVLTEDAARTDSRVLHHVAEVPDARPRPNLAGLIHVCRRMRVMRLLAHQASPASTPLNVSIGRATGSPFVTSDRCAA